MKKFLTFILVLAMVMSVSSVALAASTLPAAVDGVIKLTENVVLEAGYDVATELTIDLNGYSITPKAGMSGDYLIAVLHGGKLTIKDSKGGGSIAVADDSYIAIKMTKAPGDTSKVAELVVESGTISSGWFAISGNGNSDRGNTKITIKGGTVTSSEGSAIYHPQDGTINISGGTVSGYGSGIAIKSGTLNITGGKVECTGPDSTPAGYSNGVNASGAAIQIESNNDYAGGVQVIISAGSVESENGASIYEYADKTGGTSDGTKVDKIEITGGSIEGKIQVSEELDNKDKAPGGEETIAISGGEFSEKPAANLIAAGSYTAEITEDGDTTGAGETPCGFVVGKDVDSLKDALKDAVEELIKAGKDPEKLNVAVNTPGNTPVDFNTGDLAGGVEISGNVKVNGETPSGRVPMPTPIPEKPASSGSGISVKYNGGNSFSTSNPSVPTGVEIDGVPVTFNGTGSNFSVGCISSDAKWVTVRWNSTSVTTNFTPDGLVECTNVSIPKTGGMSIWAAIAQFLGF